MLKIKKTLKLLSISKLVALAQKSMGKHLFAGAKKQVFFYAGNSILDDRPAPAVTAPQKKPLLQ
jgi:hypothetical protein